MLEGPGEEKLMLIGLPSLNKEFELNWIEWQWRYHNVYLAPFLTVINADLNNTIFLWFIQEITHILHIYSDKESETL